MVKWLIVFLLGAIAGLLLRREGIQGPAGYPGPPGPTGLRGAQGLCSCRSN